MIAGGALAWLAAAFALGIAELLVPGVFLVFLAVAAALTGCALLAIPALPLPVQLGMFAVWSIVAVLVGRRWYRDYPLAVRETLNDRAGQMVGQRVTVDTAIVNGRGRVRIGDGSWPAEGPDLAAGTPVRIVAVTGGVVTVHPIAD